MDAVLMDFVRRKALLEASLERAAADVGDITPHVLRRLHERHPDARPRFVALGADKADRLEHDMVEQALFCLMDWFDNRSSIEIVLAHSAPHHIETLGVSEAMFAGLITAVCETISATIPAYAPDEAAVWRDLEADMLATIAACARDARPVA